MSCDFRFSRKMALKKSSNSKTMCKALQSGDITGERSFSACYFIALGGAVASWLVRSTPERGGEVRALPGDIVLCSWARHFTLTVPLSTQVYKLVLVNCWGNLTKLRGSELRWTSIPSRGSRNTSNHFVLQKPG